MPEVIDKQEILKRNPHIDKTKLDESIVLAQQLMASGLQISRYNLASPFSRRRIKGHKGEFACTKRTGSYRRI